VSPDRAGSSPLRRLRGTSQHQAGEIGQDWGGCEVLKNRSNGASQPSQSCKSTRLVVVRLNRSQRRGLCRLGFRPDLAVLVLARAGKLPAQASYQALDSSLANLRLSDLQSMFRSVRPGRAKPSFWARLPELPRPTTAQKLGLSLSARKGAHSGGYSLDSQQGPDLLAGRSPALSIRQQRRDGAV
jgi:hypothetical protein